MLRLTAFSKKANFIGAIRDNYISNFGPAKWEGLEQKEREKHSLYCIECSRRGSTFPNVTGPGRKKKSRATSTDNNTDTTSNCHSARPIPHKVVVEAARKAFSETNENFAKTFRTPLARVLPKVRELNLTPRKTKNQKQQILRNTQKKIKKAIMSSWQKEGRDIISVYGTRRCPVTTSSVAYCSWKRKRLQKNVPRGSKVRLFITKYPVLVLCIWEDTHSRF